MGRASYKQKCIVCRKNMALVTWKNRTPVCAECQMRDMNKPITDPEYQKLFDIKEDLYKQSSFLRNIKANYLRFGKLSEKQIETFKKVVHELENPKPKEADAPRQREKSDTFGRDEEE